MHVVVETINEKFTIEVEQHETLLNIKKKFEERLGIPVSKQAVYFQGKLLLHDDYHLTQYNIFKDSTSLHLFHALEPKPKPQDQVLRRQAEQSSKQPVKYPPGKNQDSPFTNFWTCHKFIYRENILLRAKEIENNQDLIQDSSSDLYGDLMFGKDLPMTREHFSNIQSFYPVEDDTTQDFIENKNQTKEESESSISTQEVNNILRAFEEVFESNEESSPVQESTVIADTKPPQKKLRLIMLPCTREGEAGIQFVVEVNMSGKVGELRQEVEKFRKRSDVKVFEEGYYFFKFEGKVLADDQTFRCIGVTEDDTIEILDGHVTN